MSDRNHEGYHDPTASQAIRRADRSHKETATYRGLTYPLQDAGGFPNVYKTNK